MYLLTRKNHLLFLLFVFMHNNPTSNYNTRSKYLALGARFRFPFKLILPFTTYDG